MSLIDDLQGSWRVVYSELGGEMTPVAHFATIVIRHQGNRFSIESEGQEAHAGTVAVDEASNPARITYTYERSTSYPTGVPREGIVQVAGDTFKTCMSPAATPAPRSFNTTPDSASVLSIHNRVGAEGGTGQSTRFVSEGVDSSQW
jgi:uncharacterized protein (TIGR03067 family)